MGDVRLESSHTNEPTRRIEHISGILVDAPCGSGHMLSMYHEEYDKERPLLGVDLSPQMVEITRRRLGAWEGSGTIDYGGQTDRVAVRHGSDDLQNILTDIGFTELNCKVEFDEEMGMNAVYIEASKKS